LKPIKDFLRTDTDTPVWSKLGRGLGKGEEKYEYSLELTLSLVPIYCWLATLSLEVSQYILVYRLEPQVQILFVQANFARIVQEITLLLQPNYFVVAVKRIFFVTKGHFPGDGVRSDENQKWPLKNGRRKDRFKSEPITFSALLLLHLFFEDLFFFWIKKICWRLYVYDLFKSRYVETLTLDGFKIYQKKDKFPKMVLLSFTFLRMN
jgi:hypothetical protein